MIQRFDPRVIGGFVLGALALIVVAILVFGSGQFFRKYERAVVYFQGSVGGLRPGAPVDLRGVQVGTVQEISIQYDVESGTSAIPVILDLDPRRVKTRGKPGEDLSFSIERMVERGLRAELRLQSFVTGQMAVQLTFRPGTEPTTVPNELAYPEIPAVPSTFEQAQEILTELAREAPEMLHRLNLVLDRAAGVLGDFSASAGSARDVLADLGKFSKALGESDQDVRNTLITLNKLVGDLDRVAGSADGALTELGGATRRVNRLLADNDVPIRNMIAQFSQAGVGLSQLTDRLNLLVQENRAGLKDFSSSGLYDLGNLIRDTQDLVSNLNRTIDDFRRNPSQFLLGQQQREVPANRAKTP
jgi:paraquat-inducible protein B